MIEVSFTEEFWPGQKEGTFIGRIEWYDDREPDKKYPFESQVVSSDRNAVEELREKYDLKDLTLEEFDGLLKEIDQLPG